jgi:hypothetical protein
VVTVSPGLASKLVARVSWFGPQNQQLRFGDLGLKITTTVSWFGPQNRAGHKVCRLHHKTDRRAMVWDSRWVRVSQSDLKTSRGTTVGAARDTITEVASSAS